MDITTALTHLWADRYINVASLALLIYDFIVTFDEEVLLFWDGCWSLLRILFIANRYNPILFQMLIVIALTYAHATPMFCAIFIHLHAAASLFEVYVIQLISYLRISAIYNGQRTVMRPLGCFLVVSCIVSTVMVMVGMVQTRFAAETVPAGGNTSSTCVIVYWAALVFATSLVPSILFDCIGFVLAKHRLLLMDKFDKNYAIPQSRLQRALLRDTILYFLIVPTGQTCNLLMFGFAPKSAVLMAMGLTRSIVSIAGTRMLLRLRHVGRQLECSGTLGCDDFPVDVDVYDCTKSESSVECEV